MAAFESRFKATGTDWKISLLENPPGNGVEEAMTLVKERIEDFEKAYSRFRDDSIVAKISRTAGAYRLPDDARAMLEIYRKLYELTDKRVTPLIGQVLEDAGYDRSYSLKPKDKVRAADDWDQVMSYEFPILTVRKPLSLDFGAVGKGAIVDIAADLLKTRGFDEFVVDAGGDMAHVSKKGAKISVGLEDPDDRTKVVGIAYIAGGSIAGSSGNRRAWDRFTHIIDAKTSESPKDIKALWVTAGTTAVADGLATGLFFSTPEGLAQAFDFEYAAMLADRSVRTSAGFPGTLFHR